MTRIALSPLAISACSVASALGHGKAAHAAALADGRSGLAANDFSQVPLACSIGRVAGLEEARLPPALARFESRNNRLAWLGLGLDGMQAAVAGAAARYGADRVGVLLGTSTGSIGETERGYREGNGARLAEGARRPEVHSLHGLSAFVAEALALSGPCATVSTACSSSAKVFAMAERMIRLGLIDAAVVGGVDTLCESVLFGFHSLELISPEPCRPFDCNRRGISIGEAAGFALLEQPAQAPRAPRLLGYGESSDAWHMSTPHPDGTGAEQAMLMALASAGQSADEVDYVNLHGTGTIKNDEVEAAVMQRCLPATTRISSTKGMTGHTLGAAGIVEVILSLLAMEYDTVPANVGCREPEPSCAAQLALVPESRRIRLALSNSFGFGGNNACLALAAGTLG